MARKIQLRRDTAINWSNSNPTLAQGEVGIDLTNNKLKIGTGSTAWNSLSYWDDKVTDMSSFAGHIVPSTDNTYDLGAPDKQWRDIYVSEGSIYIGDIKLSNDNGTLLVQQVTDAGLVTETPIPGSTGVVTTDRLVVGEVELVLTGGATPFVTFPASGTDQLFIQGSEIGATSGNIALTSADGSIILITHGDLAPSLSWTFDRGGTLTTPLGLPKTFTAVLDSEHFATQPGRGLVGTEWQYGIAFAVNPDGTVETQMDDPTYPENPGYIAGDVFRFTEADHGIPGYTFDITLNFTFDENAGLFVTNPSVTPPPEYPSTVESLGAIKLTSNDSSWVFGANGDLTLPESSPAIKSNTGIEIDAVSTIDINTNSGLDINAVDVQIVTRYTPQVSAICSQSNAPIDFQSDITNNDDITAVQGGLTWYVNDPAYPIVSAELVGNLYVINCSAFGAPGQPGFVAGETYTFYRYNEEVSGWTFTPQGGLATPGAGEISHRNNDLRIAVTGVSDVIVLSTAGGDLVVNSDGSITFPDGITNLSSDSANGFNINVESYDPELEALTYNFSRGGNLILPLGIEFNFQGDPLQATGNIASQPNWLQIGAYAGKSMKIFSNDSFSWTFNTEGDLELPAGGDILDSEGNSVLGGGGGSISVGTGVGPSIENVTEILINGTVTEIEPGLVGISVAPPIANTRRGWINLVGDRPNNNDTAWFEAVTINGGYAYVAGGDYYTNSNDLTKIYKFNLDTGEQVWVKEVVAGRGALFDFAIASEVITIGGITNAGIGYLAGEELHFPGYYWSGGGAAINRVTVVVDTVDAETGAILTASIKPGYNLTGILDQLPSGVQAENDNARGAVNSIAYDLNLERLIVVSQYRTGLGDQDFDNYYYWTNVYVIDPVTGDVDQTATLRTDGDVNANSIKLKNSLGGFVIVGEKFGEFRQFGTLTLLQGYNGYFDILKSEIDEEHYPGNPYDWSGDFLVSGTGISSYNNVDNVNYYEGLTTTVRQGSGATFDVVINATSIYSEVNIVDGGNNYLVGHKILIPGTSLEGISPTNDIVITVTSVSGTTITGIDFIAGSYGNTQAAPYTYSAVSGTNYQTGSGAQFNVTVNPVNGTLDNLNVFAGGSNYVSGDVLTVSGTSFAGGTNPANNLAIVVGNVDPGGIVTSYNPEGTGGTASSTALRIYVNGVDFTAVGGSWSMKQNLGGEAFVWTPQWSNAIGGASGDRFYDVCYSQDGNSIFAVGRGYYETTYSQALLVKFDATTGAVVWGKDIKFSEAATADRDAHAICLVPGSSDLLIVGSWYNPIPSENGLIVTRVTEAGVAVWQKTYDFYQDGGTTLNIDNEVSAKAFKGNILISAEMSTPIHSRGLGYLVIDPDGLIITSRVLSADGNSNYNFYETPTPQFSDAYTDADDNDYVVMAGHTYVPTDNYYNALLIKLPLDGYKDLQPGEWVSLGEHILSRYWWAVTTVTPAFESFTATEHPNTITTDFDQRNYNTSTPTGLLNVWTYTITDDSAGYLEFGDGSKQSFATDVIPQIPAANDYYLTAQDSGKHIFFEHASGEVFIPHWNDKNLPVGFTFTVVNLTGNTCYVTTQSGDGGRGRLKLAGRNIDTYTIGIPDSGSGSMVTFLKIKSGYSMMNTDWNDYYDDVWIVSGPGDIYDND